MAFIRLKDQRCKILPPEQAVTIWRIMNGEITGDDKQQRFANAVDKIYLNRATAPQSYLRAYPDPSKRVMAMPTTPIALPYKDD